MSLRELLREWLDADPDRSARRIAEKATAAGTKISHQNVNNILNGSHGGEVGEQTIKGLAKGTGILESRIRRAAGVPPEAEPFVLPDYADRLTRKQRDAVRSVVDAMVKPEGRSGARPLAALPVRPRAQDPLKQPDRAAARPDTKRSR